VDGAAAATIWLSATALEAAAPAHAPGTVTLSVEDPDALPSRDLPQASPPQSALARGLFYLAAPGAGPGALALGALSPLHGPLSGGVCPGACLLLTGSGLSQPDLVVTIGGAQVAEAAVHIDSDQSARVDLPAGSGAGPVDVVLSSAAQGAQVVLPASDPGAFRYDPPLSLAQVSPSSGPAAGGTQLSLSGTGFLESPGAPLSVRVGALAATQVQVSADGALTAVTPAGPSGAADVTVTATDPGGYQRSAVAPGAYTFTGALALYQVDPPSGAQSGGLEVTLRGRGFASGLAARFGSTASAQVTVLSATEARCVVPAGVPGAVDVQVGLRGESDTLPAGYSYFDPQTNAGGSGGGPLLGALNVTVIDATPYIDGNVAGANVEVQFAEGAPISAVTDGRGQVTLSDPRLVTPVQVTVTKPLYTAVTVVSHQAANLTVWLSGPVPPPPPPPPGDPQPPVIPQQATIGGHVYGFKQPPGLVLKSNQRLVAYVRLASTSVWASPPFSPAQTPIVVDHDGGAYSFTTTRLSNTTLTAMYGVEESLGQNLSTFTPLLLGVRRDLQPDPNKPITDADLILDTHLDQQAVAQLVGLPAASGSSPLTHQAGVVLDLGSSGYVPLSVGMQDTASSLVFPRLPQSAGQGFVFIDEVQGGNGVSIYLRRIFGDVLGGFTLGPYLPFPQPVSPGDQAQVTASTFDWTFRWQVDGGLAPNLLQLRLDGNGFSWSVVLPGDARSVALPASLRSRVAGGQAFSWTLTASLAPGFDYTFWSYYDLYGGAWTSYAYGSAQFTVKQ
jgi:hypothetical protein